ncbi:PREDICTED: uncharacterized protein LOC107193931 [Dufourea novaeangliae]|uniref:uncharacterized protein LOC107193931 n=1 Tax=Dufourea novaeangliae TaxID=178035 RepID=UPI000767CFFA|nr:PREDICTED: uncharacterized protein LOC107193931 [Dufourea novaeangliae]
MARRRKRSLIASMASIIGSRKNSRLGYLACNLCDHYIMGNSIYVIMLGFIGTVITAFDIIRVMNNKIHDTQPSQCKSKETVPLDVERDLKLMTSILGIEHYTLIMLGAITEYPMLHTPWLLMQLCVIIVEVIVFCVRVFLDGLHVKRDELLLSFLTVHNWLQVFCLFHKQVRQSR